VSYHLGYIGTGSGEHFPADTIANLDASGRPLRPVMDVQALKAREKFFWYTPQGKNMWETFGALLLLDWANPEERRYIVSLGEGNPRWYNLSELDLARTNRITLEACDFANSPATWSFKDLGFTSVISMANWLGRVATERRVRKIAIPTQGNAGDSLVRYAIEAFQRRGNIDEVAVVAPRDTPKPIIGSIAAAAYEFPGKVHLTLLSDTGTIQEAGKVVNDVFVPRGFYNASTLKEPWRWAGKSAMGLRIAEARPQDGKPDWEVPEVVVYPVGGGTGLVGMWYAWQLLQDIGVLSAKRPRLIGVQSEATDPLVQAYERGASDTVPVLAGQTALTGLNVPGGVGHQEVLNIFYASGGGAVRVSDQAAFAAIGDIYRAKGVWFGTEGGATVAALPQLVERGWVRQGEHVVVVNTGALCKYYRYPEIEYLARQNTCDTSS
jgi:threonine synthase